MRRTEAALAILHAAGLDLAEALSYLALLDRHVYPAAGAAADETSMLDRLGFGGSDIADTITAL